MICLNMIVKNERAQVQRALESVKPYISTFAILDTGSTDGTDEFIKEWAAQNGINGIVGYTTFVNFSQARNQALDLARTWHQNPNAQVPYFDYLLLMDADMQLVVADGQCLKPLSGEMYEMVQKAGAVSYHNPRLLAVSSKATYVGVTHEYLNVAPAGCIAGAHFIDHADGSNRKDKFERDIKLLKEDLKRDPGNARSWFYLGNSYRDSNRSVAAIDAYKKRLELGGWDEENFVTMCNIAACYKDLGDADQFLAWCMKAYEARPSRAESLYDAAHYLREQGRNELAMLFVEKGVSIPRPDDKLFVNDFVYSHGFREEFSIAGYYTGRREQAFRITNGLALDKDAPEWTRRLARHNMVHYLKPLQSMCPSVQFKKILFRPNEGFELMNPSVANTPDGALECIVRTVNYRIDEAGRYMIGEKGCGDAPIVTENYLVDLTHELDATNVREILWCRPEPEFDLVRGLEDMRLFWVSSTRKFSACVREQSPTGQCEQWEGALYHGDGVVTVFDEFRISDGTSTEKNWAPIANSTGDYMYRLDRKLDATIHPLFRPHDIPCRRAVENISGSSQWIEFNGGYLSVVHEAIAHPAHGRRVYQHRFAFYDRTFSFLKLSLPFVFQDVQIEFCAGLAGHPTTDELVISFGVRDCEAWLARVRDTDVMTLFGG